jgi:hypothetical protein
MITTIPVGTEEEKEKERDILTETVIETKKEKETEI